jgi:hypothetical protein
MRHKRRTRRVSSGDSVSSSVYLRSDRDSREGSRSSVDQPRRTARTSGRGLGSSFRQPRKTGPARTSDGSFANWAAGPHYAKRSSRWLPTDHPINGRQRSVFSRRSPTCGQPASDLPPRHSGQVFELTRSVFGARHWQPSSRLGANTRWRYARWPVLFPRQSRAPITSL